MNLGWPSAANNTTGVVKTARLKISGPEALVTRFNHMAGSLNVSADIVVDPAAADVTVTLDDTIVETRIAAWMDRVVEAASAVPHV